MYMYTCVRVTYAYEHIQNAYMHIYMADHVYFNMYTLGRNAYMYAYIKISCIVHVTHTYSHTCARVHRCAHIYV